MEGQRGASSTVAECRWQAAELGGVPFLSSPSDMTVEPVRRGSKGQHQAPSTKGQVEGSSKRNIERRGSRSHTGVCVTRFLRVPVLLTVRLSQGHANCSTQCPFYANNSLTTAGGGGGKGLWSSVDDGSVGTVPLDVHDPNYDPEDDNSYILVSDMLHSASDAPSSQEEVGIARACCCYAVLSELVAVSTNVVCTAHHAGTSPEPVAE